MDDRNMPSKKKKGLLRFLPDLFKRFRHQHTQVSSDQDSESSLNPSFPTPQRSSLFLQSVPPTLQVGQDRSADPPIGQAAPWKDTPAPPVATVHDTDTTLPAPIFPVPMISINTEIAQNSFDPTSVTSHIQIPAPISVFPHDEPDAATPVGPVAAIAANPATTLAGDHSGSKFTPPKTASANDNFKVAGRFLQTVITRIPEIIDTNPVKVAFGIAKVIIDIKNNVEGNMDMVERKIVSIAEQLEIMGILLGDWKPNTHGERLSLDRLESTFQQELNKLAQLRGESIIRKVVDYENEKSQIADIFERINEARIQFGVATDILLVQAIHDIGTYQKNDRLEKLLPSDLADHKYYLEGEKKKVLQRTACSPGTRARLLNSIVAWAKDPSSETLYWLFGRAGTGKTTIAYTVARHFELTTSEEAICLGGNFFSSRQFEETRFSSRIIRTIVYHLAVRCEAFAGVLIKSGNFNTVNQNVRTQLNGLLVKPWQEFRCNSPSQQFLIVIDALDEIEGTGGSDFLRDLLDTINENWLPGLKFFVTSRPDPMLVNRVETFTNKQLYHLEEVPLEEAGADIKAYLNVSLPCAQPKYINNYEAYLFINKMSSFYWTWLRHQNSTPGVSTSIRHLCNHAFHMVTSRPAAGFKIVRGFSTYANSRLLRPESLQNFANFFSRALSI